MTPTTICNGQPSLAPVYIGPKELACLAQTLEFLYRTVIWPVIDVDCFQPIYSDEGNKSPYHRPPTSPKLLTMLSYLKGQYGCSDAETIAKFHFDARFLLATNNLWAGKSLPSLDHALWYFRERCLDYANATGTNPFAQNVEIATLYSCALSGQDLSTLRSDSIEVSDHCARRSREEMVYMAVRIIVLDLLDNGTDEQKRWIETGTCCEKPGNVQRVGPLFKYYNGFTLNCLSYEWCATTAEKRKLLCQDATEVLTILDMTKDEFDASKYPDIALGVRVINEQTKVNANGDRVFVTQKSHEMTSTMIQTMLDLNSTYRKKVAKHFGYVLNCMESTNGLSHMTILSCLYPNVKNDDDMEIELYESLPSFEKKLDAIYAEYPALVKGDPEKCQDIFCDVLSSIQTDFVNEGTVLYNMLMSGQSSLEEVKAQQRKILDILDSFYSRLKNYTPAPAATALGSGDCLSGDVAPGCGALLGDVALGNDAPLGDAAHSGDAPLGDVAPGCDTSLGDVALGNGATLGDAAPGCDVPLGDATLGGDTPLGDAAHSGDGALPSGDDTLDGDTSDDNDDMFFGCGMALGCPTHRHVASNNNAPSSNVPLGGDSGLPTVSVEDCSRMARNWSYPDGNPALGSAEFGKETKKSQRRIILDVCAQAKGIHYASPDGKLSIADGQYTGASDAAKAAGYTQETTNFVGKKNRPIIALFSENNGVYSTCPLGKRITKQSTQKSGTVSIWLDLDSCAGCPCAQCCGVKLQTKSAKVTINPRAIPAIISEARAQTNGFQHEVAWCRNGSEAYMSWIRNVAHCDLWPIGMEKKRWWASASICASNIQELFLFVNRKTRVHPNAIYNRARKNRATVSGTS